MARISTNERELIAKDEVYAIIGAAMEVHNVLGAGFAEAVYQEAMEIELRLRKIPFERQRAICVKYKDVTLECSYRRLNLFRIDHRRDESDPRACQKG